MASIDQVWRRLRSPFRYPQAGHSCSWERYDADRAGCVLCGALHRCSESMINCTCPLAETNEGGHVCLVTGLCISEVRSARCEFVDSVCFDQPNEPVIFDDEGVHDKVAAIIRHFLTSNKTVVCRRRDQEKHNLRAKQAFWRVLKQRKRENPYTLPCLCSVVAEVVHSESLSISNPNLNQFGPLYTELVERVVHKSAANIASCIMQIQKMGFKKILGGKFQSMIVGMLYMSRTGLYVGNVFRLPAVRDVKGLLPSETYLNSLGVSNKVICDTENEIKSCIRAFTDKWDVQNPRSKHILTNKSCKTPKTKF
jgi:hypothetical protein